MIDLPSGWEWATIGDVGHVMLGRQRSPKWHHGSHMRPYLRVANVFEDRLDLSDIMEMDFPPEQFERYKLVPGDILLNEGQSPEWVGRPAMYNGELPGACFTNSLIRFRPHEGIDGRFALYLFRHHLRSRRFMREARITTNIAHLSATRFASVEFPVPPTAEQQRIVGAIEEHLSRLDSAGAALNSAVTRVGQAERSLVEQAVAGDWEIRVLGELLVSLRNGCFVSRPAARPPGLSIYRISAVRPMALDVGDIRYAPESLARATDFMVNEGDLLFTRYSGNPAFVGACAVVPAAGAGRLHPDKLIRGVVNPHLVLSDWVALAVTCSKGRREIEQRLKTTAGQVGISGSQLRSVPIPVPPISMQARRIAALHAGLRRLTRLKEAVRETAQPRSALLRRSILAAAFGGKLVPQDPADEPASVLLERIRAERAVATPARRRRKAADS